jgi:hypothetical protein
LASSGNDLLTVLLWSFSLVLISLLDYSILILVSFRFVKQVLKVCVISCFCLKHDIHIWNKLCAVCDLAKMHLKLLQWRWVYCEWSKIDHYNWWYENWYTQLVHAIGDTKFIQDIVATLWIPLRLSVSVQKAIRPHQLL